MELVSTDQMFLNSGDAIPADVRIFSAKGLRGDESLWTGDSEHVEKNFQANLSETTPFPGRHTLVHAATAVV